MLGVGMRGRDGMGRKGERGSLVYRCICIE